jgi:SAM-dependent methyltransferase
MTSFSEVEKILESAGYQKGTEGIFKSGREGYWSNLDKEDNKNFIEVLEKSGPIEAVREVIPQYEDIIFSPRREAALELLNIQEGSVAIDYGCMWGVLSVGMAKRGASVVAIDQTLESLKFLSSRSKFENLDNIICVQDDIRKVQLEALADFAVVNGVLEWVPEEGDIEIKRYYGKKLAKDYGAMNPESTQKKFLEKVGESLKEGGKLLLAIENRLDYTHFLGKPDPHVNLPFTAILPRVLANAVSKICLGRPYVNYIYSFSKIKKMLFKAGFQMVDLYAVYPDYRYPSLILPYEGGIERYTKYWSWRDISWKRRLAYSIEYVLMSIFKAQFLAPSIIAVAKK